MPFHRRASGLNPPSAWRAQPQVRFRGEADIDRQARLAGSVKMTPSGHLKHLVTDRAMEAWYHPFIACMTPNRGSHGKPHRTTKILSDARRRGSRLAARGVRAAAGDAGDKDFLGGSALADRARYLSAFRQGIRETGKEDHFGFDPNEFKIKYSSFVKTPILDIIRRRGHHSSVLHPG
jgi:hypothetical protein